MSDFITLSCPNCGGKLEVSPSTLSLVCQHCGVEHLVRREAGSILLEGFARCPMCNRNDRAERVSAIVDSHSTNMATILQPPPPPPEPAGFGCWWILLIYPVIPLLGALISVPLWVPGIILANVSGPAEDSSLLTVLALVLSIGGQLTGLVLALLFFLRMDRKKRAAAQEAYNTARPKWEAAMRRWKRLYYCARDGVVYDPETGETCDPAVLKDFVYSQS